MKLENNKNFLVKILKWSENYTGTDMVYLAKGGFWLSLAQFTVSISGFLLTLILANLLTPDKLGEYRFLISGFTLLGIIALPGMRTALRESTPKGYYGNLTLAFNKMLKWGLVAGIISLLVALYYYLNDNTQLAIGFIVIALAVTLNNSSTGYLEYLTALKKLNLTTIYTASQRIVVLIITAITAFLFPNIAWIILAAYLFGAIIPNLWFHFKTTETFTKPDDPQDEDLTRYSIHISAMTALGVIAGQLDKLFVWKVIGAGALATFYIAYTLPLTISQYLLIIPTLAFAKFGEKDPKEIRRTLLKKIFKYLLVIILGVIAYIILAPYIFEIIFPQYPEAVTFSKFLIITSIFAAFMPIKTYLTTIKNTKALYVLSIIPPAIRIVVAVVLIIPFGIWGAVWSLLAEGLIRTILLLYFFIKSPK